MEGVKIAKIAHFIEKFGTYRAADFRKATKATKATSENETQGLSYLIYYELHFVNIIYIIYCARLSLKNRCCFCCFCCFYSEKTSAGRGNAKLGTSSLQTSHAKIANYTLDVFNRITLWHNPQNKG